MKRANSRKRRKKFLGIWVPDELLAVLDKAVEICDTDRSKLVRHALKEKVLKTNSAATPPKDKP
jgi:metal-responsive CopG/Arc/MetJ family transcriptional regulator